MPDYSRSHHLYIATDGKLFKVGRTNNVRRRCRAWTPLQSWWCPGLALEIEYDVKQFLRKDRAFSYSFEWFAVSREKMFATVALIIGQHYFREPLPTTVVYAGRTAGALRRSPRSSILA